MSPESPVFCPLHSRFHCSLMVLPRLLALLLLQQLPVRVQGGNITSALSKYDCGEGQVYVSEVGGCMMVQKPGTACQYSQQCSGAEAGAFCVNMRCHCVYGMVATSEGRCKFVDINCTERGTTWVSELGQCLPVIAPGNSLCTHDQQCNAAHAESRCFLTQCTCPPDLPVAVDGVCGVDCGSGKTFSGVMNKCIETVQPGNRCEYSSQCNAAYRGMVCHRGSCRCPNGEYWTGTRCVQHCPQGQLECHSTGQCRTKCLKDQVEHDGSCYEPAKIGERCGEMSWCAGGSACVQGICRCPLGSMQNSEICVTATVKPGSSCAHGERCDDGSVCQNNLCVCPKNSILINDRCAVPQSVPPGARCHRYVRCSGGSICRSGVCVCPRRSTLRHNRCVYQREVPPFGLCTAADVCTGGSVCKDSRCTCPEGYAVNDSKCVKSPGKPGDSCTSDEQCLERSRCVAGVCTCSAGYKLRNGICTSVVMVNPGQPCDANSVCTGSSHCTHGVCTCRENYQLKNGECLLTPAENIRRPSTSPSSLAEACPDLDSRSSCSLPDCFCSRTGFDIPGGLDRKDTPQMVVFTIDDPVNDRAFEIYKDLFGGSVKNKNGCPITATFFLSHEYNQYDQCQWLYWKGNELAVNSITHETLSSAGVKRWSDEMAGMRRLLSELSGAHLADMKGVRAPQLNSGGNDQFMMMHQDGFTYDNSMSANPGPTGPAYWPQTLDYKLAWKCEVPPCPNASFPGIWAVPINQMYGCFLKCVRDHRRAAMVRGLMRADNTVEDVYRILLNNFNRHYESNRAPFIVTLNVDFFLLLPNKASVIALESFITEILHKEDVWIVNMQQMLDWIRNPVPVSRIAQFKPWSCETQFRQDASPCKHPMRCLYTLDTAEDNERWFKTCFKCPASYPWISGIARSAAGQKKSSDCGDC